MKNWLLLKTSKKKTLNYLSSWPKLFLVHHQVKSPSQLLIQIMIRRMIHKWRRERPSITSTFGNMHAPSRDGRQQTSFCMQVRTMTPRPWHWSGSVLSEPIRNVSGEWLELSGSHHSRSVKLSHELSVDFREIPDKDEKCYKEGLLSKIFLNQIRAFILIIFCSNFAVY